MYARMGKKLSGLGKGLIKRTGIYRRVWQKLTVEGNKEDAKKCLRRNQDRFVVHVRVQL